MVATMNDVSGEAAKTEGEPGAEEKKRAKKNEERPEKKQRSAELTKRVHARDCSERGLEDQGILIGSSNQFHTGEEIGDFEGRGFGRV